MKAELPKAPWVSLDSEKINFKAAIVLLWLLIPILLLILLLFVLSCIRKETDDFKRTFFPCCYDRPTTSPEIISQPSPPENIQPLALSIGPPQYEDPNNLRTERSVELKPEEKHIVRITRKHLIL